MGRDRKGGNSSLEGSVGEERGVLMRRGSSRISLVSLGGESDCLSERNIGKFRRMVVEREKEERRDNLVIKSWKTEGKVNSEKIEELIREKVGVK